MIWQTCQLQEGPNVQCQLMCSREQGIDIDKLVQSFARAVGGDAYSPNTGVGKYVTY